MKATLPPEPPASRWLLRRADQATVAGLVLFSLGAMAYYWIVQGGLQGRMIDIDRVDPLSVQFQVDLNTAEKPELITLPEVGDTLAQHILDYRQQHGPFESVDELRRVRGFGPKTMERLRPYSAPRRPVTRSQSSKLLRPLQTSPS